MRLPVGVAELVGDQQVGGLGIGDAQERLGEAEQRHALRRVEPIFLKELVDPPPAVRRAQIGEQRQRMPHHPAARLGREPRALEQRL